MTRPRRVPPGPTLVGLAVAVAVGLVARSSHAEDIGVVAAEPGDPFVTRVVRELEHLGLSVARGPSVAASRDVAVLEIGEGSLDLHESLEGGTRKRRRLVSKRDAVEVAEEVHALLLPLVKRAPAPSSPPVATAAPAPAADIAPAPAPEPSRSFWESSVEVALGAGAMLGTSEPGVASSLGVSVYPRGLRTRAFAFGLGLDGLVTIAPEGVSGAAGSADVRAYAGGLEAIARLGSSAPIVIDAALGISVNHVTFSGAANAPFTSKDESATSVSPTLRARATYGVGRVGLFLDARTGFALPEIAVRFAGADVATWGRPWACLGGGVALGF
ncbi:MAG: hypothetical protein JST00_12535 [Deltaproteobacteria bacterium]|nr:hypothetical protein [Deltaproteobacteria bacterium]